MNAEQAHDAVTNYASVIAYDGPGGVYCAGNVVGYSIEPQVLIITPTGERVWWRADMVRPLEERP